MLSPPAEVLLSYFTGLAPVGRLVEVKLAMLLGDLGYAQKTSFYRYLGELVRRGCIKRLAAGSEGSTGLLMVTRRLETCPRHLPAAPAEPVAHPRAERTVAQFKPIPPDTRGLTSRLFGDPIFERSALAGRVGA